MKDAIILPGIGGSGASHWQSIWEERHPSLRRFEPADWNKPELDDWCEALERAVAASAEPPVLVAHSLACLLVAHWQARSGTQVNGALLVAVPDPASDAFPPEASDFADPPRAPLRFRSLIVASTDDPYGTTDHARDMAARWGSDIVLAGALGHINGSSRLGDWPDGWALLREFASK
ncbi:alpha/beta hydrolase [Sinorhizobium sp. BG8]|uniref:RBBP9/YdeN family alpha/beta hydrolase n=1 Tax=Sinorhizobium sp. BG8 TaxID=2613773 RepID=UPI00193E061E|nr:alpha/beta hydrolase [Sinorhizobium sp. BG8]QRM56215.1 serine hydrolase family protein [Sinorhizobium sp. BG8]